MNWRKLLWWRNKPASEPTKPSRIGNLTRALTLALAGAKPAKSYQYDIKAPDLFPGVLPSGTTKPLVAMDNAPYTYARQAYTSEFAGFPGYPYLASLATRAEYRAFASTLATERTREWIVLNSTDTAGESTKKKITELTQKIKDIGLQKVMRRAAEHDCLYGRGQIFIKIKGHNPVRPLILDKRTISKDSFESVTNVEPMWTTPSAYNASDPTAPDFYKPLKWLVMGKEVHASRLMTMVTRELPDMLKPAYNFSGMSLSQLAEPYVDNWLRTRQSVADLINNFSITALKTSMDQVLNGDDNAADELFKRAALFTAARSNKGLMLLDKDREELVQTNVPLGGLDALQAQSQEHMCAVSRIPAAILTGISPKGLNASSDGEIRSFNDWIAAQQEAYDREPIETVLKVLQISMYSEIDPDITMSFEPLYQMTPKELAEIRLSDSTAATNYINAGVIAPDEDRERLARDSESGYQGLDLNATVTNPNLDEDHNEDDE